ncbi:hypothetical protein GIB67_033854, partial [Kingdonia uniflora]
SLSLSSPNRILSSPPSLVDFFVDSLPRSPPFSLEFMIIWCIVDLRSVIIADVGRWR